MQYNKLLWSLIDKFLKCEEIKAYGKGEYRICSRS